MKRSLKKKSGISDETEESKSLQEGQRLLTYDWQRAV
jgi:hypothetical protein